MIIVFDSTLHAVYRRTGGMDLFQGHTIVEFLLLQVRKVTQSVPLSSSLK